MDFALIKDIFYWIVYIIVSLYLAKIVLLLVILVGIYMESKFTSYYEEQIIKEKEQKCLIFTNAQLHHELYCIIIKYNPEYNETNDDNSYNNIFIEAKKLYNETPKFRIDCYKNGLRPRLLQIINNIYS
jgi:hypothetical protein